MKTSKKAYSTFENILSHLEEDINIGKNHKSVVITLAGRASELIVVLETPYYKADNIETTLNNWLKCLSRTIFKLITFDYGKECSTGKICVINKFFRFSLTIQATHPNVE